MSISNMGYPLAKTPLVLPGKSVIYKVYRLNQITDICQLSVYLLLELIANNRYEKTFINCFIIKDLI